MALNATELCEAMANALPDAWHHYKPDAPVISGAPDDSKILFLAIAAGLLKYLQNHSNDAVNSITLTVPVLGDVTYPVKSLVINTA